MRLLSVIMSHKHTNSDCEIVCASVTASFNGKRSAKASVRFQASPPIMEDDSQWSTVVDDGGGHDGEPEQLN